MSEPTTPDPIAPVTKAIGDLNTRLDGEFVKKSDMQVIQKSLNDATAEIRVLRDRELDKPGMGMFTGSREFYATLAKAWRGDAAAKKTMFEEYPAKLGAYLKAPAGQNEGIDSQGGIFVLPEYSAELLRTGPTLANIRQYMRSIPMQGNLYRIRALVDKNHQTTPYGGIAVYRGAEAATMTATKAEWEWIELKPSDLTGMAVITDDLLEDATAFASLLPPLFMGRSGESGASRLPVWHRRRRSSWRSLSQQPVADYRCQDGGADRGNDHCCEPAQHAGAMLELRP